MNFILLNRLEEFIKQRFSTSEDDMDLLRINVILHRNKIW